MARIQAFEIHELPGCPDILRRIATDYLRTVGETFAAFLPVAPLLRRALDASPTPTIIDLCSGGSGPVITLAEQLQAGSSQSISVVLTDLYPNLHAFTWARARAQLPVQLESAAVDARRVPERLVGVRTMFDAFHHFPPEAARGILADAAKQQAPILIVEATERSFAAVLGMLLFVPLLVLLLTPFVKPFNGFRLLLTYVIPVAVPLIVFDGVVSCLRSYTVDELRQLVQGLETEAYRFEIGTKPAKAGRLTYVLGAPR